MSLLRQAKVSSSHAIVRTALSSRLSTRPGWREFLSSVAAKYEMHVYTMGTRAYAEKVCEAIDPDGDLFGGRILSRDESGSQFSILTSKYKFHTHA